MNMPREFDLIVVGGGMVGAAFALMLAGHARRVAVIEANRPDEYHAGAEYDLRVSAFSRASQQIFEHLAVWPAIASARVSPYLQMHVWDAGSGGEIRFDAASLGEDCLGHIIENRLVQSALLSRLAGSDEVELFCPAVTESIAVENESATVRLVDGRVLRSPLVVAADGARSKLRELMHIELVEHDYRQAGVVCSVATEIQHAATARQRFLAEGPVAFLPLADGRCSIVWTCPSAVAESRVALDSGEFAEQLGDALEGRLGRITDVGARARFPLRRQHARRYVTPRFALIGDAAHTIHPLAGQGVNLGLLDAAVLAEVLIADTGDWGRHALLRRYERWRRGENEIMLRAMDGFQWLFGSTAHSVRGLRGLGLNFADRITPLKHQLMRRAMGLSGDLPRIALRR